MPKREEKRCPYEATCPFAIVMNTQEALFKGVKAVFPEAFREHLLSAEREVLLALRSLIDALLERMERRPRERAKRIPVE